MTPINPLKENPSISTIPETKQRNCFINLFLKYCCCCCSRKKIMPEPLSIEEKKTSLLLTESLSYDNTMLTGAGVGSVAFSPKISSATPSKDALAPSQEKIAPIISNAGVREKKASALHQKNRPGTPYYMPSHLATIEPLESAESTPDVDYLTIHQGPKFLSSSSLPAFPLPSLAQPMLIATAGAGIDPLSATSTPDDRYFSTDDESELSPSLTAFALPSIQVNLIATAETTKQRALTLLMRKDSIDSLRISPSLFTAIDDAYLSSPTAHSSAPRLYVSPLDLSNIHHLAYLFTENKLKKELPSVDTKTKIALIEYIVNYNPPHDVTALVEILNKPENHALFEELHEETQRILIKFSQVRSTFAALRLLNKKDAY